MDKTELYSGLSEKIITIQQLHQCLEHLRQSREVLYKKGINITEELEKTLPYYLAEILFEIAKKNNISLTDTNGLQELLQDIQTYLEQVTIAEIVIAYVPTYRHIQEIAAWWQKYAGKHVVLNIQIDDTVIGGARVSYEGIYKDYSIASWLKQNTSGDIDQFN